MDIHGGRVVSSAASQQEDHGFKVQQSQIKWTPKNCDQGWTNVAASSVSV